MTVIIILMTIFMQVYWHLLLYCNLNQYQGNNYSISPENFDAGASKFLENREKIFSATHLNLQLHYIILHYIMLYYITLSFVKGSCV